ncbi:MAG: hypothetical protein A2511_05555 [Deltaproteobacteria bacterium RIFOXYD12_FULL_50_9]|nr:MAG: hypothetical protein A2511_05555 [Deltaproteobacteria bacterium RIFOXYD12_FULL_50_9]
MLTISREVIVKIGKHAWAVYPLEAFGYLLGTMMDMRVYAVLPYSKTSQWDEYADRWLGIEEHLDQARAVGSTFDLEVVGFYTSTETGAAGYPIPTAIMNAQRIVLIYGCLCCPSCSGIAIRHHDRWLRRGEGFTVSPGKRISSGMNQKRVLKEWRKVHGPIDYSNGWVPGVTARRI